MPVKVLIVDDSGFFRRRLKDIIESNPDFKVVAVADNGSVAIEKTKEYKPDVITMDYEMPVMDGITAVEHIMREVPTPILMFSSLTFEGARITLRSLEAGAIDYMPKNFSDISNSSAGLKKRLFELLTAVANSSLKVRKSPQSSSPSSARPNRPQAASSLSNAPVREPPTKEPEQRRITSTSKPDKPAPVRAARRSGRSKPYGLVAIGTSTGGPVALADILKTLPKDFRLPLLLVQHMPGSFTQAFAERLNAICDIEVREGRNGDRLKPGVALLAPGGKQMMIDKRGLVKIMESDERLHYRPCIDVTFGSAANVFHDRVLAIILTGMGADGCDGSRLLKKSGSTIWAQDQASSTIYGMPMAVAKAGLADEILALDDIGSRLKEIH